MKIIKSLIVALMAIATFTQCDALRSVSSNRVTSQGSPYEVVVVCNQPEWESELGDSLRSILGAQIPYLNQEEVIYSVIRVTNQSYKDLIARHRNILEVNVQPSISEASIAVRYDLAASPQIVLTLQAPSIASATAYVSENRESLVQAIEMAERDRSVAFAKKYNVKVLGDMIFEKFGVKMNIPEGYLLRDEKEDFIWMSYEYPIASQGIVVYSYPAEFGVKSLTSELLLEARNKYTAYIPGPSEGSYMTTYAENDQLFRPLRINGRLWCEMRGFWDVANDFMGGPYVSYSTIDEATNRVFTIDCYVYSPKYAKRNYIKSLEHIVYGTSFPTPKTPESESHLQVE